MQTIDEFFIYHILGCVCSPTFLLLAHKSPIYFCFYGPNEKAQIFQSLNVSCQEFFTAFFREQILNV